jgi:hypothetical protein
VDEILAEHDNIYDSPNPVTRTLIEDLASYPMEDNLQEENKIYAEDGKQILRRTPIWLNGNEDPPVCPPLVNLRTIGQFFQDTDILHHSSDDEGEFSRPKEFTDDVKCTLYPQAYLKRYGQVQADGVSPYFLAAIKAINSAVGDTGAYQVSDDDDAEPYSEQYRLDPLKSHSCQIYKSVAHKLMERAGGLDAVKGDITGALAGSYARTGRTKAIAQKMLHACQTNLPHDRARRRLLPGNDRKSLRVENVYILYIQQMKRPYRKGR